jgi:hypothetical protein
LRAAGFSLPTEEPQSASAGTATPSLSIEPDPGHSGSTITVIDTVSVDSAREPI